jgi:hypothetical protein
MTQPLVQGLPGFIARTVLSASSSVLTSLEGIDCSVLEDGAFCFVREEPLSTALGSIYRYYALSARVPEALNVITATGGGQWLRESVRASLELKTLNVGTGGTAPASNETAASQGWTFAISDLGYQEFALNALVDRSKAIIIGFNWAPTGSEAAQVASWEVAITQGGVGKNLAAINTTKTITDAAVGAVVDIEQQSTVSFSVAEWGGADLVVDELHVRLKRIASSDDPAASPAVYDIFCIQPLM